MRLMILLFLAVILLPVQVWAANTAAASCSYADMLAAYNAASAGDTITIPPGNCTWSSGLTISKAITLQGAGSTSTIITSSTSSYLISATLSTNVPFRITGIGFNLGPTNNARTAISVVNTTSGGNTTLDQVRLDHNAVTGGGRYTVSLYGKIWGVVDHNVWTNTNVGIYVLGCSHRLWTATWGDPASSASPGPQAGTANALFIEDNQFLLNSSAPASVAYD